MLDELQQSVLAFITQETLQAQDRSISRLVTRLPFTWI